MYTVEQVLKKAKISKPTLYHRINNYIPDMPCRYDKGGIRIFTEEEVQKIINLPTNRK